MLAQDVSETRHNKSLAMVGTVIKVLQPFKFLHNSLHFQLIRSDSAVRNCFYLFSCAAFRPKITLIIDRNHERQQR